MTTNSATLVGQQLRVGVTSPLDEYRPVLALTLLDQRLDGPVVMGVRTSAANRTHQNVLSVPTIRVAEAVAGLWLPYLDQGPLPTNLGLLATVRGLAAQKLGLGDALERNELTLDVIRLHAWQGTSVVGEKDGVGIEEQLTMFNAVVVAQGGHLMPKSTASYEPLRWIDQKSFREVVRTRDVQQLGAEFNPIAVCVHGLCVATTRLVLDAL